MFKIVEGEPLARHTTFRIGGPAEQFVRVESRQALSETVAWGRQRQLDVFILGNGSNILVKDEGIRGLVIENHADAVTLEPSGDTLRVHVESGVGLPGLANRLARQGWGGLEWAIGVPATVGAAVVTNAGAHGGTMSAAVVQAELLDREGHVRMFTRDELDLQYRASLLKRRPNEYVVLTVDLELARRASAEAIALMNQYTEHRRRTQPTEPSVGSMFKNPEGDFAGRLIEAAGLKGTRVGQVEVSNVHANFFVNRGGATAAEVLELVDLIKMQVLERFGVRLELEIQVVGH